jgi:hypothetical protein
VELRGFEPLTSAAPLPVLQGLMAKARSRTGACFRQRYVSHQSGHRTFLGVCVAATTVARSIVFTSLTALTIMRGCRCCGEPTLASPSGWLLDGSPNLIK